MKQIKTTLLLVGVLLLAACVTINIYFPSAEAEAAAERIVDDILGKEKNEADEAAKGDTGASFYTPVEEGFAIRLLNLIIPTAQAAQPDFNVNTPKVRKLQAKMKKRHSSLKPHYASGGIGFTRDALVAMRDSSAISLKNRNKVKKLVSAENGDRNALYRAIAEANGHPEWESKVRATFAQKWAQRASDGWWYQGSSKQWKQK
ncbi:MAG: YdbL family protein [Sedimenticola sp.]